MMVVAPAMAEVLCVQDSIVHMEDAAEAVTIDSEGSQDQDGDSAAPQHAGTCHGGHCHVVDGSAPPAVTQSVPATLMPLAALLARFPLSSVPDGPERPPRI